ncbi:MAG: DNA repair protein RecN [Clostridiales bacterium]|nr:DNA repair protein RecN [Clostridiales bacterium]
MIRQLTINNIALIDHLDIEFQEGLTVLSGETGSGKSIIIDSLAFVLGDRADKTLIKYGQDYAEVTALFEVDPHSAVLSKLDEYGYGNDCEILIYRKMSTSGKNEIRIQGKTTTQAILKEVCAELVDIFGQGQHLALLNEKNQLSVLDAFCDFGGIDIQLKTELYPQLTAINKELKSFGGSDAERERLLDILKYQIDEIVATDLSEEEEDELLSMHKRMVNVEKISTALNQTVALLQGEQGASAQVSQSVNLLRSISNLEDGADELSERLLSVRLEIDDVADQLDSVLSATDFSPAEVDKMEGRLEKIRQLKRKYGGSVADVLKFLESAQKQYDNLLNSSERIEQLNAEKRKVVTQMYKLAQKKSAMRRDTAQKLAAQIMQELNDLGMRGTNFTVQFNDEPSYDEYSASPSADGFDKVEFLMSANVGEPLKPLSKVISGGEMSRFMLAVKNITALAEKIPTMVFDEIDTGISGNMAQMVANKLANVSTNKNDGYQCVVITHLPQIAAMADVNLYIRKYEKDGRTYTAVDVLTDYEQRAREVSRLMGSVGEHAIVNAKELLDWSANYKNNLKK